MTDYIDRVHFGWNFIKTKEHFKKNPPKAKENFLIVSTQYNMTVYEIATAERVSKTRIYFSQQFGWGGSSFYYSGKNCFSPKGQTRLVPLVAKVQKYFNDRDTEKLTFVFDEELDSFLDALHG